MIACLLLWAAHAFADPPPSLVQIQRASREARYNDAKRMVQAALASGGHGRAELVELYRLGAELACILDGPGAGEQLYRRMLALDPNRPAPERDSPVLREPFARARAWIATAGHLEVQPVWSAADAANGARAGIRVVSDPLAMVARVAMRWRIGAAAFQEIEAEGLTVPLPAGVPLDELEIVLRVLDRDRNTLVELGTEQAPLRSPKATTRVVDAPPKVIENTPRPRRRSLIPATIGTAVAGLALLGAAIGLDVAASREFDALDRRCMGACTASDLSTLHVEEGLSGASYGLAAASLTTATILLIVDRVRHAKER